MATTETDIWRRVVLPEQADLPPQHAEFLLRLGFSEGDHDRMAELSARANDGSLTADERRELEGFINVGHVLAMLQSKARLSLRQRPSAA